MQKIRIRYIDCTATVQKIKFVYAQFRGTVTVKVALDHFLQIRKEVKIYVSEKLRIFLFSCHVSTLYRISLGGLILCWSWDEFKDKTKT